MASVLLRDMGWIESPATVVHIGVNTSTIIITGQCKWVDVWGYVPEYNSKYEDEGSHLGDMRYLDTDIVKDENGITCTMTLNIGPYDPDRMRPGLTIWSLSIGALEKPIKDHTDYVVGWDHDTLVRADHKTEYFKPNTYVKETYSDYTVTAASKPSKDSFILPSPVVEQRTFYALDALEPNFAATLVGERRRPAVRFGVGGGDWLVMSAEVRKNGDLLEVIIRYQYADDWDTDIYPS